MSLHSDIQTPWGHAVFQNSGYFRFGENTMIQVHNILSEIFGGNIFMAKNMNIDP